MPNATLEYRSVTDLVHDVVNPGHGLARHANREGLEGRPLYSEERKQKMEGGAEVHSVLETLRDEGEVDFEAFPLSRRGYARGLTRWQKRFSRRIVATEIELVSQALKVRGRADYIRACQKSGCTCEGAGLILGDLKVGRLVAFIQAHLQVAAYRYIWIEEGREGVICGGEVLCVNALGDFAAWPALASPEAFLKAADWHTELAPLRLAVEEQKGSNR